MFGHRRIGFTLLVLGILTMSIGSVVAGSEGPVSEGAGTVTGLHQVGWVLGALGAVLTLVGIVAFANARRAFF